MSGDGNLTSRDSGPLQSHGDLTVSAGGSLNNTTAIIDGAGRGSLMAAAIGNMRGQGWWTGALLDRRWPWGTSTLIIRQARPAWAASWLRSATSRRAGTRGNRRRE